MSKSVKEILLAQLTWLATKSQSSIFHIFNIIHRTYIRMQKKNQVKINGIIQLINRAGPAPSLIYFTMLIAG